MRIIPQESVRSTAAKAYWPITSPQTPSPFDVATIETTPNATVDDRLDDQPSQEREAPLQDRVRNRSRGLKEEDAGAGGGDGGHGVAAEEEPDQRRERQADQREQDTGADGRRGGGRRGFVEPVLAVDQGGEHPRAGEQHAEADEDRPRRVLAELLRRDQPGEDDEGDERDDAADAGSRCPRG